MDIREKNWIAIIGSREPTDQQRIAIGNAIRKLNPDTDAIISGCAYGIDALALETGKNLGFETIGILPWSTYNRDVQAHCTLVKCIDEFNDNPRIEAYESVMSFHPCGHKLSQGALKLHARNYGIIRWASQVIAAPSNKPGGGGTGQGIRLAEHLKISLTIIAP